MTSSLFSPAITRYTHTPCSDTVAAHPYNGIQRRSPKSSTQPNSISTTTASSDRISLATQPAVSLPSSWPDVDAPPQCALYRPLVSGRMKTARLMRGRAERADSLQYVASAVQLRLLCSSRLSSVGLHCEVSMWRGRSTPGGRRGRRRPPARRRRHRRRGCDASRSAPRRSAPPSPRRPGASRGSPPGPARRRPSAGAGPGSGAGRDDRPRRGARDLPGAPNPRARPVHS